MRNWIIAVIAILIMRWLFIIGAPSLIYLGIALFAFSIAASQLKERGSTQGSRSSYRPAQPYYGARPVQQSYSTHINQPQMQSAATTQVQLPERPMLENFPTNLKCPSCGATIKPTDTKCAYCGSTLKPLVELPEPVKLGALEIGQSVKVRHPQLGDNVYNIRGRLLFTELWQASKGPSVPWTPTGNFYAGFALEPKAYLLNWQDRFYLLLETFTLTDMDINTDFMPYAREFAQSNQTAAVQFHYAGTTWQIVDIGRYAIEYEDGEGNHLHKGAIGRFIHASSDNMALIVDDFQSGGKGGQDTLWRGFQIKEADIKS
jgi:hypothetical protein